MIITIRHFIEIIPCLLVCCLCFKANYVVAQTTNCQLDSMLSDSVLRAKTAERIENGIKKYGKENLQRVLLEMLQEEIKEMHIVNPMDTIYDAMIRDLKDENRGINNHAVEKYSHGFRDSLMRKLYNAYYVSKREHKYKEIALSLISASVCKALNSNDASFITVAYNNVLLFRNYEIAHQVAVRKCIQSETLPFFNNYYKRYCDALDSLNYSKNYQFSWEFDVEYYGKFELGDTPQIPTFADVKNVLPNHSSMIEYSIVYFNESPHLCAFIYDNKAESPFFVILDISDNLVHNIINSHSKNKIDSLYQGNKLYESIIAPILPFVSGKMLFIAPASYLSNLNFSAIRHNGKLLSDSYNITRLFSAAELTESTSSSPTNIALFGDVKYDLSMKELESSSSRYRIYREPDRGKLLPLTYSLYEVEQIKEILVKHSNIPNMEVSTYLGKEASEAAFKSFNKNSPSIIHLATHGYYIDAEERQSHSTFNVLESNNNKLIFSGLLLAGATLAWNGNVPMPGVEDGILTADEISRMDLSSTNLVVTSACSTALGDENETEGIFGLQRAFKQAGVKMQIITLWPVKDQIACDFMTIFYEKWISIKKIRQAFTETQKRIRAIYPDTYSWAPFILVGCDGLSF